MSVPLKIISGGQTGADIAALDWAIGHGLPHGGWCPRGRKAENGTIPRKYNLKETESENYAERTEKNVVDSDGTVIFTVRDLLEGGSKFTWECAVKHNKPVLHLHAGLNYPGKLLADFIRQHRILTLNVAGPRASSEPNVGDLVKAALARIFHTQSSLQSRCLENIQKYAGFGKPAPHRKNRKMLFSVSGAALPKSITQGSPASALGIEILCSGRGFPRPGNLTGSNAGCTSGALTGEISGLDEAWTVLSSDQD